MESRGNGPLYPGQGSNFVRGSLNWGASAAMNRVLMTSGVWEMRRGSFDRDFHTYSVEWDHDFM